MYIWVLVVLVVADGEWRDWNSFGRESECLEIVRAITHHREDTIKARCERRKNDKYLGNKIIVNIR